MADYLHGAYGEINSVGNRVADAAAGVIVYVGTAPVHQVAGGKNNVNKPIVVNNIAEAKKYFGYSEDWAAYTLCEAMHVHFELKGVGPIVLINVLDPAKHKETSGGTASKTAVNGVITIPEAEKIVLDTVKVGTKVAGTDYTIAYDFNKKCIVISEIVPGALGTSALSISYDIVKPSEVGTGDVVGATDGLGNNTGVYAVKDVYPVTGLVPSFLVCPGFSSVPAVHTAMYANSNKVNGHWDVYMLADLPIVNEGQAVTLATAATFKATNNYTHENETVYYPLAKGSDGQTYHLSVLAAANLQGLLAEQGGIPFRSPSNTECAIIENLYFGEENIGCVIDDSIINERLNKFGIASAAYVGGRWVIWGAHSADYTQATATEINVAETNRMMLNYISNDFQVRRTADVDQPLTVNDIRSIVSEEQARLDALVNVGALTYGTVVLNADADTRSDIVKGDYTFAFTITTTPLAKSLTAIVNWSNEGFTTYFEE